MFAVAGMGLFGDAPHGEFINEHANFETFASSLLVLIRISTGESWNGLMHDALIPPNDPSCDSYSCYNVIAIPFFVSFVLVGQFMMLNLLVAVVLEEFSRETTLSDDERGVTLADLDAFREVWGKLAAEADLSNANLMPAKNLKLLLTRLPPPLGLEDGQHYSQSQIARVARHLKCQLTANLDMTYHDVQLALCTAFSGEKLPPSVEEVILRNSRRQQEAVLKSEKHALSDYNLGQFHAAVVLQRWWSSSSSRSLREKSSNA